MHLPDNTELQHGKYKIIRFISSGGFGCTYEGFHDMMDERVAIKEFFVRDFCNRDDNSTSVSVAVRTKHELVAKLKRKFVEEARALRKLRHPNIVSVYDVFDENGTSYFVMDYIDGPSLNDVVKKRGALPQRLALKYVTQIAEALEYVHAHNRLHLDIKPGNIMLARDNRAVLIDFGASKQYDEEAGENTSTLLGKTPGYAPIEQMGNNVVTFSPATDIYSLGATLYKLLTGITPPAANLIAGGDEVAPLPGNVYPSVREAVAKAMKLSRKDRPQTAREFIDLMWKGVPKETSREKANEKAFLETIFDNESQVTILEVSRPGDDFASSPESFVDCGPKGTESTIVAQRMGANKGNSFAARQNNLRKAPFVERESPKVATNPRANEAPILEPKQFIPRPPLGAGASSPSKKKVIALISAAAVVVAIVVGLFLLPSGEATDSSQARTNDETAQALTTKEVSDFKVTLADGTAFTYSGPVNAAEKPDGHGIGKYDDGTYEGDYVDGICHGKGKFTFNDNTYYEGTFKNGEYEEGHITSTNGSYFEGTFRNEEPYNGRYYKKDGTPDGTVVDGVER